MNSHLKKKILLKKDISFHDISIVFNNIESTIYNDFYYTNEYANKLVAEKIIEQFVPNFKKRQKINSSKTTYIHTEILQNFL
jgi:hypothetical protein